MLLPLGGPGDARDFDHFLKMRIWDLGIKWLMLAVWRPGFLVCSRGFSLEPEDKAQLTGIC